MTGPAYTSAQLDGLACISCGADLTLTGSTCNPAGFIGGRQVWVCRTCPQDAVTGPLDGAE